MRKWIIRVSLALILLFVISVAGLIFFIRKNYSPEKVKAELESTLKHKTGLLVSIGSLEFTWAGDIKLRQICIRNPAMTQGRCLVAANITSLDLRVLPLLKKRIEIRAAHLEDMAINLYTEAKADKTAKNKILKSWDIPIVPPASTNAGAAAEMKLDALKISSGLIVHEAQVLPLPLGNTKFKLAFSEGNEKKVKMEMEFSDGGHTGLNLKVRSENLLQSLRLLAKENKATDTDTISGEAECKRCNISAADRRLTSLTGKFNLQGANNQIEVSTERAEVGILSPVSGILGYTGKFTLLLPALTAQNGSGSLSGSGLTIVYSNLKYSPAQGIECDFDTTVDFKAAHTILKLPANLKGVANAHGKFVKNSAIGAVRVSNFEYMSSAGFVLQAPSFSAGFVNSTLTLANQSFRLNQNNLSVSGSVTGGDMNLKISAPTLQYQKWRVDNFSAALRRSNGLLQLSDAAMVFAGGRVTGAYTLNSATRAQTLRLNAAALKAQHLGAAFGLKSTVFGQVAVDANMAFSGDSAAEMRKTLSGNGTFRLGRGKIKDSFLQKGILNGPLYKLEQKFSDIEFVSGSADVTFSAGRINARKVFFDADEWNLTLRSESDSEGAGKATLDFRFRSTFVENVANPLHLGIEGRKEGDFYELPFACRGNVFSGSCYKQNW